MSRKSESNCVILPDWIEAFLSCESSDKDLIDEIEYAIGRKDRQIIDEDTAALMDLNYVCAQIIAESQASNVALDCY